eukprot:GFYU01005242.1.p1 GENE.GFYU01005242.1~~GFYU01005242.1.p1  ORF type:complete len:457 (-),score=100.73 GFYU01005242.1:650-2020(-)
MQLDSSKPSYPDVIGWNVKVNWPDDGGWASGVIIGLGEGRDTVSILYDDDNDVWESNVKEDEIKYLSSRVGEDLIGWNVNVKERDGSVSTGYVVKSFSTFLSMYCVQVVDEAGNNKGEPQLVPLEMLKVVGLDVEDEDSEDEESDDSGEETTSASEDDPLASSRDTIATKTTCDTSINLDTDEDETEQSMDSMSSRRRQRRKGVEKPKKYKSKLSRTEQIKLEEIKREKRRRDKNRSTGGSSRDSRMSSTSRNRTTSGGDGTRGATGRSSFNQSAGGGSVSGSDSLKVKVVFGDHTRLMALSRENSMMELERKLSEEYDEENLTFTYKDDEGDTISIRTEQDLQLAVDTAPEMKTLKIYVVSAGDGAKSDASRYYTHSPHRASKEQLDQLKNLRNSKPPIPTGASTTGSTFAGGSPTSRTFGAVNSPTPSAGYQTQGSAFYGVPGTGTGTGTGVCG